MNIMQYLDEHRESLCAIFSQIYSGREIELSLNTKTNQSDFEKSCCVDTIIIHKYNDGEVEFPIDNTNLLNSEDESMADELHSIVLCEQAVKDGLLFRKGLKYTPTKNFRRNNIPNHCRKYIIK